MPKTFRIQSLTACDKAGAVKPAGSEPRMEECVVCCDIFPLTEGIKCAGGHFTHAGCLDTLCAQALERDPVAVTEAGALWLWGRVSDKTYALPTRVLGEAMGSAHFARACASEWLTLAVAVAPESNDDVEID